MDPAGSTLIGALEGSYLLRSSVSFSGSSYSLPIQSLFLSWTGLPDAIISTWEGTFLRFREPVSWRFNISIRDFADVSAVVEVS